MAATAQVSDNRPYLFRLQMLIIDGGTPVVREIFDNKLPGLQLQNCLTKEKSNLKSNLKNIGGLSKSQFDSLYPKGSLPAVSSNDFDLTLLICLLRNLKGCGLNPKFKWIGKPQSTDLSVEADICRLKTHRNKIAHISSTTGIDEPRFNKKWDKIEKVLLRLNSSVPNAVAADLQLKIHGFKYAPLDPEEVAKLQKKWKELEKDIENEMMMIKEDQKGITRDLTALTKAAHDNTRDNEMLKKEVKDVQTEVKYIREDNEIQKKNIESLKTDMEQRKKTVDEKQRKREFVEDLTALFEKQYRPVPVSPLVSISEADILEFFVEPSLNIVKRTPRELRTKVKSYQRIFSTKSKTNTIYLTGQAGCGKTTFAKMLCMIWCCTKTCRKANCKIFKSLSSEMEQFDFLFYIPLRDVCGKKKVSKMIFDSVVKKHKYEYSFLKSLLKSERCLILLDGLDEWSCPSEGTGELLYDPCRYKKCTFFITTRRWKLNEISTFKAPSYVELLGIDEASQVELINNVIFPERDSNTFLDNHEILRKCLSPLLSLFCQPDKIENEETLNLIKVIRDKNLSEFSEIPVILIQLTFIWLHENHIGDTRCEIYFTIINLLLQRGETRLISKEDESRRLKSVSECKCYPEVSECDECEKKKYYEKYHSFLKSIGKLAFEALFCSRKELSLMIDSKKVKDTLTEDEVWCCLKIGILTENVRNVMMRMQQKESTYSFIHKTFQEFFCAFYLTHIDESECILKIRTVCESLKSVVEIENVLIYLCGLNNERFGVLSKNICEEVVANDEITKDYRCRIRFWFDEKLRNSRYLQEYQYLNISCIKECGKLLENSVIYFEDIFFENRKTNKKDDSLEHLIKQNKAVLKSVSISDLDNQKCVECFELLGENRVSTVEKLNISSEINDGDLDKWLGSCSSKLRYLSLCSYTSQKREGTNRNIIPISRIQMKSILKFKNLRSLSLESFQVEHNHLCTLTNFLTRMVEMEEIRLQCIQCINSTDHEHGEKVECQECQEIVLDLSRHKELRSFELVTVNISQVRLNTVRLEECVIGDFVNPKVLDSILESLSNSNSIRLFTCSTLIPADVDRCLKTMSQVPTLEQLVLKNIDVTSVTMSYLEDVLMQVRYFWLLKSNISCLTLKEIVEKVGHLMVHKLQKKHQNIDSNYQGKHQLIRTKSEETNFDDSEQLDESQREDSQLSTENKIGNMPQGKTGSDETLSDNPVQQEEQHDLDGSIQDIQPIEESQVEKIKQQRKKDQQESKQEVSQNQDNSPLQVSQEQEKSTQVRESQPRQTQQLETNRHYKNRNPGKYQPTESNHDKEDRKSDRETQFGEIKQQRPVMITVYSCSVTPKTEFQKYKLDIRDSKHFKVTDDWRSSPEVYKFSFERNYDVNEDLTNNEALTEHTN